MADLAVGLAKSVVEGTLSKAQAAISEEAKLRESAQRDLVFITGEFQMMQAFLKVANAERVENQVVMTWVRQIRELAYDVEDCVEFVIHLDSKSSTTWCRRLIPSFFLGSALPLDLATQELKELKARVEEVSRRNHNYNLISDTGSKPVVVHQQQHHAADDKATALSSSMLMEGASNTGSRMRQGDLTQLLNRDLRVISVRGSGGSNLGVTSVIWKAYHSRVVCKDFPCRAWIKLSLPFDSREFARGLRDQFYANYACGKEQGAKNIGLAILDSSPPKPWDVLEDLLNKQRYLVVLEDLSTITEWDAIGKFFPHKKDGSCIIVSTQQSEVASLCVGHPYQALELNNISPDHSVYAFYKEGSHSQQDKLGNASTSNSKNKTDNPNEASQCKEETLGVESASNPKNKAANQYKISVFKGDKASTSSSGINEEGKQVSSSNLRGAKDWIDNNVLFGRDTEMKVLHDYITDMNFHKIQFMSVWGIAGVGKSSLVKKLFCERIINDNKPAGGYFDMYGWVDVSYPFKLRDFSQSLLLNFHSAFLDTKETACSYMTEINNPILECQRILKHNNCLVVIDCLKSTDHWDLINAELLSGSSDNCIITITTEASIATHCSVNKEYVLNVKCLGASVAYNLFKKKVPAGGHPLGSQLSDNHDPQLGELVSKCGGLPKVIVETAFSIGTHRVLKREHIGSLSNNFMHELETNRQFDRLRCLFSWVRTYFQSCPDFLKPCIFYLSIFPRDFLIRRRRLLRRWIAEGYSRDSHEEFAEQCSEKLLLGLLDLSLIQQQPQMGPQCDDTRKVLYQVNGFFREYIVSKRMEENLVFELGESSTRTTQRAGRHLVVMESWKRDRIVFESIEFSRLRSLTVFGKWEAFFISDSMRLLRVLDLENASGLLTQEDLRKVVKVLLRLKFLSLRGHSEISSLPDSLHKLRQLETLDVRGTSITTLPEKIIKMQQLQYIRAGTTMTFQRHVTRKASTVPANVVPSSNCGWLRRCGRPAVSSPVAHVSSSRNATTTPAPPSSNDAPPPQKINRSNCCWLPARFWRCQRSTVGVEVPMGTGEMTALHTLGVVDIAASGASSIVEELRQLTQLRKLGVSGINRKNCNKFFSAIQGHAHLESLSVQFDKQDNNQASCCFRKEDNSSKDIMDGMSSLPCCSLLSLKLYGLEDQLSSCWGNNKLRKLTKLELEIATLTEAGITFLGKLPELCILRVKQLQDGELCFHIMKYGMEDYSFDKLKVLYIGSSSPRLSVTFGSKSMKELELLRVECPSSTSFSDHWSGMVNLSALKEVRLVTAGPNNDTATQEEQLNNMLSEHPNTIRPIVVLEEAPHST